jgi:hypothetical protein
MNRSLPNSKSNVDDGSEGDARTERPATMKRKYFAEEDVFALIWEHADRDGHLEW